MQTAQAVQARCDVEARVEPRELLPALGFPEALEPEPVTGGWDTLLWRFRSADGVHHALRVYVLPNRNEVIRRERLALETCARAGFPAPRPERQGELGGLPALVQTWLPGAPLLSLLEKEPWRAWSLGTLFGRAQAQLHRLTPPAEFMANAPGCWLSQVSSGYEDLVEHARRLSPSVATLIHLDYHPLNVIVTSRGALSGVIDWAYAAAGDPRADLAVTEAVLMAAPLPPGPTRPVLNLMRRLMIAAWHAGYRAEAGTLPDYRPWLAWGGAMMLGQMALSAGRPQVWGTEEDMSRFRSLVQRWAVAAGAR